MFAVKNIASFNFNAGKMVAGYWSEMANIENEGVKFIGKNDKDKLKPSQS